MPFYLYFGLLGLVVGGVLVWLLNAAHPFETKEEPWRPPDELEAGFLARQMTERGRPMDEATVQSLLELHTAYLDGRIREEQALTAALGIETARAALAERDGAAGPGEHNGPAKTDGEPADLGGHRRPEAAGDVAAGPGLDTRPS